MDPTPTRPALKAHAAAVMGIESNRVEVTSIKSGSIVVSLKVWSSLGLGYDNDPLDTQILPPSQSDTVGASVTATEAAHRFRTRVADSGSNFYTTTDPNLAFLSSADPNSISFASNLPSCLSNNVVTSSTESNPAAWMTSVAGQYTNANTATSGASF